MLITFGGPDFSGKSTLIKNIKKYYEPTKSVKIFKLPFPDSSETIQHLSNELLAKFKKIISANNLYLTPILSISNIFAYYEADTLYKDSLVLFDRGFESTLVYQGSNFVNKNINRINISEKKLMSIFFHMYKDILNLLTIKQKQIILLPSFDIIKERSFIARNNKKTDMLTDIFETKLQYYYNQYLAWLDYIIRLAPATLVITNMEDDKNTLKKCIEYINYN